MIKTQLCPAGELENKNWWHLDVLCLVLFFALGHHAVSMYLDGRREDIQRFVTKKEKWDAELAEKAPQVSKFNNLSAERTLLTQKIGALQKITTSKLDKVKPIVALDQLQTLWIDGVWYEEISYSATGELLLRGAANDSLLVGEYMLGLRETMNPETRNDDIRTQLGFDALQITTAKLIDQKDPIFVDIKSRLTFELKANHKEKVLPPAAGVTSVYDLKSRPSRRF
jgi:hypothetical protein